MDSGPESPGIFQKTVNTKVVFDDRHYLNDDTDDYTQVVAYINEEFTRIQEEDRNSMREKRAPLLCIFKDVKMLFLTFLLTKKC